MMRNFAPCLRTRLLARAAVIVLAAGSVAACSSDATRFGGDPYGNPYEESRAPRASEPDTTGGITPAPSSRVERAPLSAPSSVQARPMKGFESQSSGEYRTSSMEPRSTGSLAATRAALPRPAPMTSSANWSAERGTTVTAGRGETAHTLSRRYGVPASAIMQANGMSTASVAEGSRVVIPSYGGASAPRPAPMRTEIAAPRPAPMRTEIAAVAPRTPATPKTKMTFVAGPQAMGAPKAVARPAELKPVAPAKIAEAPAKPKPTEDVAAARSTSDDNVKTAALKVDPAPAAEPAGPSFRWPARGRVISGYGSKISGQSNDGVNIAVPEGTDIKASDDGVVAYSGSELKGFGNLVLIRHSNGYVTAYAHNSANGVKRGDTVRRGQVIAKSGSTGNVSTPQLHFEVRKGAQTVDPMKHLPGV